MSLRIGISEWNIYLDRGTPTNVQRRAIFGPHSRWFLRPNEFFCFTFSSFKDSHLYSLDAFYECESLSFITPNYDFFYHVERIFIVSNEFHEWKCDIFSVLSIRIWFFECFIAWNYKIFDLILLSCFLIGRETIRKTPPRKMQSAFNEHWN